MKPTVERMWIGEFQGGKELRASFSNERHHTVAIPYPYGAEQLADALIILAQNITSDPHLKASDERHTP